MLVVLNHTKAFSLYKASDTRARNLRKFSSTFLHLCVNEQYPSNMTSTNNHENVLENFTQDKKLV